MGKIEGFDRNGKTHIPEGASLWAPRKSQAEQHTEHAQKFIKKTTAQINKERTNFFQRIFGKFPGITEQEHRALHEAFVNRLPYLAPENRQIPSGTSVESLLKSKSQVLGEVHYGQVSLSTANAIIFEKLQRELATIDEKIATRQLYQLMNGSPKTHIIFSELGLSAAIKTPKGRNVIHVNTRWGIIDPASGALTPLCVVLGHEIEHANIPSQFSVAMANIKNHSFTNAEEVRVINGYENAMLEKLGQGERSTHNSYLGYLDPADGKSIAFPFHIEKSEKFLRPGDKLEGKLIDANHEFVTICDALGKECRIDTAALVFSTMGLEHIKKLGFKDSQPFLEKSNDFFKSFFTAQSELQSLKYASIEPEHAQFIMPQLLTIHSSEVKAKIAAWKLGATRGDILTVKIDKKGLTHLSRLSKDPNPIDTLQQRSKTIRQNALRNTAILALLAASGVGAVGLAVWYAVYRTVKKHRTPIPVQQTQQQLAPQLLYASLQLPAESTQV